MSIEKEALWEKYLALCFGLLTDCCLGWEKELILSAFRWEISLEYFGNSLISLCHLERKPNIDLFAWLCLVQDDSFCVQGEGYWEIIKTSHRAKPSKYIYTWKAEFLSSGWVTEYKRNKQECPDHSYCTDNSSQRASLLEGAGVILSSLAYPGKGIGENRHKECVVLLTFSFYSTLNPSLWGCFIFFNMTCLSLTIVSIANMFPCVAIVPFIYYT